MKKITGLVATGIFLLLCLTPEASRGSWLGVFVGPFSPNLEEVNKDLDEAVNEEFGTNFRFEEEGLIYSVAVEGATSLRWNRRMDISFFATTTSDSYTCTEPSPPDHPELRIEKDVEAEMQLTAIPLFLTKIYLIPSKGNLSLYLGAGLGTVFTDLVVSQKEILYFIHPEGYVQGTEERSWRKHLISLPLTGQVLAGIEYELSSTKSLLLEARYIASSEAEIGDTNAGIETAVDWSGFSYRLGLMVWL